MIDGKIFLAHNPFRIIVRESTNNNAEKCVDINWGNVYANFGSNLSTKEFFSCIYKFSGIPEMNAKEKACTERIFLNNNIIAPIEGKISNKIIEAIKWVLSEAKISSVQVGTSLIDEYSKDDIQANDIQEWEKILGEDSWIPGSPVFISKGKKYIFGPSEESNFVYMKGEYLHLSNAIEKFELEGYWINEEFLACRKNSFNPNEIPSEQILR